MKNKNLLLVVLCVFLAVMTAALVACDEPAVISGAFINDAGELVLNYSDGSLQNLGVVTGEKGEQGEQGAQGDKGDAGIGIKDISFSADGSALVVEFTNGDVHTLPLPKYEYDGIVFRENKEGNYSVVDYLGADADVVIPAEYNGKPVTEISSYAFSYMGGVESVVLSDSVTVIKENAFLNCTGLEEFTVGAGLCRIGENAFDGCGTLNKVHIPGAEVWCGIQFANLSASPLYYANTLYAEGAAVNEFVVPADITQIHSYAFSGCTADIVWANNAMTEEICARAFYCFEGDMICLPDSIAEIGEYAFGDCSAEIVWGEQPVITEIETGAFSCYAGTSLTIPDSVEKIGCNAFDGCSALEYDGYFIYADNWAVGVNWAAFNLVGSGEPVNVQYREGTAGIADFSWSSADVTGYINYIQLVSAHEVTVTLSSTLRYIGDYVMNMSFIPPVSTSYDGSVAEWNAIEKGEKWNYSYFLAGSLPSLLPAEFTVVCTDGQVVDGVIKEEQ